MASLYSVMLNTKATATFLFIIQCISAWVPGTFTARGGKRVISAIAAMLYRKPGGGVAGGL